MTREIIEIETVRHRGNVYTSAQIIEQVNSWVCATTGLGILFSRFERRRRDAGRVDRCIVAYLPSGDEWSTTLSNWLNGQRLFPILLDGYIIKKEVEDFGLTFIEFERGKKGFTGNFTFEFPSGERAMRQVGSWRGGARPAFFDMDNHIIRKEVEDYGLIFIGWGKNRHGMPTIMYSLPTGEVRSTLASVWRSGSRPDGRVGWYGEKLFERNPDLCNVEAVIYYRRFTHPTAPAFYKVGISKALSCKERFNAKDGDYTVVTLTEKRMPLYAAWRLEQDLLTKFSQFKHLPDPPLRGNGNHECFGTDVLLLAVEQGAGCVNDDPFEAALAHYR